MKKILLIITMLVLGIGSTWADIITVQASDRVKNLGGKYYTIHYKFGNGSIYPVIYNGTTLICSENQNATPETFYFSFADENGFYKIRLCSVQKYWRFDRNPLIGEEANAAQIQIFANQNSGTYRICGLNTSASTFNSRCYMAQGNGGEMNYNSKDWAQNSSSGNIDVYYPQTAGNWCSEVILTEVSNPTFTETTNLTSGWYQVRIADDNRNLTDKFITTMDNEISNYPAHSAALGENKGATMFYINVKNSHDTGKWISVRDSRGRYMTRTAESSISEPNDNICAVYFTSSAKTQLVFTSALTGTNRVSWKALNNYIGVGAENEFPVFYAGKAGEAYSNNAWTVNIEGAKGTETVSYNGDGTHYGFSTVYNNGTFFFAQGVTPNESDFTFNRGAESDKYDIDIDTENKIIKILPYNIYTGSTKTISSTEWNNQENWISQVWGANGPGTTGSNMWNPIYLKDVKEATGISFEGWKLRLKLENSNLTATTLKLQTADNDIVTIDVDKDSELELTMSADEANGDPGTHNYNIDGTLTINTNSGHFTDNTNDNYINLGTTGKFNFNSESSVTHSRSFTINATLNDPANYNTVYSRELATFTNVTLNNLTVNIDGTDGWTPVNSKEELTTRTNPGKFYYIEKTNNTGVILHTYMQRAYTVEDNTKFSEIYYDGFFNEYMYIYIPSGKKLTLDKNLEDIYLDSSPIIKAESNTSVIQINEGYTLYSDNIISGQNPKIIGAGTFKTKTYTTSVPLNVTLGDEWTGTVARANATVGGPFDFGNLVNGSHSKVQVMNVTGWVEGYSTTNANIILINGAQNYGFCVNGANDNNTYTFTGNLSGSGDFMYNQFDQGDRNPIYNFSGNLSEWTGKFNLKENGTGTTTVNVTSTGNINAGFKNSSTKANTLELIFSSNSDQNINGEVTTSSKNNTLNISLKGTGPKTIGNNITANNLTIINSNGAEISISGSRTINVVNLYAYIDNNNTLSPLNINMNTDDIATKLGEDESCTLISVTGSYNASSLTINGKENVTVGDYDYYISYNDNAIILSRRYYSRNVTSGNFGSICLPNGAKVSQMTGVAKVLEVTEITTDRVNMIEVEEMTPGVPYIFKSNASAINLTLKGATEANPVDDPENYLVGNFSPVTVPTSDQNTSYYVLQSNKFKKVTSASSITSGSNRCYLKVPVTSDSRQSILGIAVDESGATGIDAMNSLINNNAEIYDINGRKLKDLRKGINIVNGVKVIVK
jgi:hypothetical protein